MCNLNPWWPLHAAGLGHECFFIDGTMHIGYAAFLILMVNPSDAENVGIIYYTKCHLGSSWAEYRKAEYFQQALQALTSSLRVKLQFGLE